MVTIKMNPKSRFTRQDKQDTKSDQELQVGTATLDFALNMRILGFLN